MPRNLLAEARQQGIKGHASEILAAAGTHGHAVGLQLFVADDQLIRQLLQAMFANFIGYFLVAQIRCGAETGGLAIGAISTKSSSAASALDRASARETIPSCSPSSPTKRISGAVTSALIR